MLAGLFYQVLKILLCCAIRISTIGFCLLHSSSLTVFSWDPLLVRGFALATIFIIVAPQNLTIRLCGYIADCTVQNFVSHFSRSVSLPQWIHLIFIILILAEYSMLKLHLVIDLLVLCRVLARRSKLLCTLLLFDGSLGEAGRDNI